MVAKIDRKNITNGPAGRGLNLSLKDMTPGQFQTLNAALKQWGSGQAQEIIRELEKVWPEDIQNHAHNIFDGQ